MQYDLWAITPSTSATYYRAAAAVAGAGTLSLLQEFAGINGVGYLVSITSTGIDTGITFTIVGNKVGNLSGAPTTEVVTGPNTTTVTSTNYYARIISITASGASAGNISIGTSGSLALPRTRIKGLWLNGAASAGYLQVNSNSTSGATLLRLDTPASSAANVFIFPFGASGEGILTARSGTEDFAIVTLSQVSTYTLICG